MVKNIAWRGEGGVLDAGEEVVEVSPVAWHLPVSALGVVPHRIYRKQGLEYICGLSRELVLAMDDLGRGFTHTQTRPLGHTAPHLQEMRIRM